ncbi:hypothetical protein A3A93_05220 [Candidatus Roizmanbacteria bacterium RIFCSPLOWO2_01_FULL_38_12]|uniref:SpoVT-AbrB domain-containing protein n=1 Tax=Candidatus Roizmanbacteria bacterium RIFCSPLOWO2_01_FULL_38_12 TaxID=1802061 RepID=A0A1F7IZ20_9BACT|nr:MAG: hypothetical protein A3F59_01650 [Candidatus Roizmanbacteria bacterium RIFCSPHIGHO2_12_FULL_38_13]OGK48597.1 MAG: hypothetical protein A3A93_05220 [Candidatus Roizmanbacteria bacterium RIFCSPLOWO2_01_FULL_38_12]
MQYTSTITQKGQITIPKKIREKLGIRKFDKIIISSEAEYVKVEPVKDILDLAGSFVPKKKVSVLKAREKMEKNYQRE